MLSFQKFNDSELARFEALRAAYRTMHTDPENSTPKLLISVPVPGPTVEQKLADPLVMLKAALDISRMHSEIGDDYLPTVRVDFGTAQIAAAFGCEMYVPNNSLPCAGNHVLKNARDIENWELPSLDAGWYGKLKHFTEVFQENLPQGFEIQHPDIQSAFNSAHLIRGNEILTDFFDDPEAVDLLLDKVTDYMIRLVPHLKAMISQDKQYFLDWGVLWKGAARISNCSMHMISPQMYVDHVFPRDVRLMQSIGGGRMHYCGTHGTVIDEFFKNPYIHGLDFDPNYHDLWELSEKAPRNLILYQLQDDKEGKTLQRLLAGNWPKKRNVIFQLTAGSVEEGRDLLKQLRRFL